MTIQVNNTMPDLAKVTKPISTTSGNIEPETRLHGLFAKDGLFYFPMSVSDTEVEMWVTDDVEQIGDENERDSE